MNLIVGHNLFGGASAQTFTVLHNFSRSSDGAGPVGGLILSGNTRCGVGIIGGSSGD